MAQLIVGRSGVTENDYISELRRRWPQAGDASVESIVLADEAVRAFPRSARLWCIRGNLIELGPESCPHDLDEALACYVRAIDIDSQFAQAWEEAGHFQQAVLDNEAAAQSFFRQAEDLRRTNETRKERGIAGALFTLLASGGTLERAITDLSEFKVQIEAAFEWMKVEGQCTPTELGHRGARLREVIQEKHEACARQDIVLAAEMRAEECALMQSLGLKAKGRDWNPIMDLAGQMQSFSDLLHEMRSSDRAGIKDD